MDVAFGAFFKSEHPCVNFWLWACIAYVLSFSFRIPVPIIQWGKEAGGHHVLEPVVPPPTPAHFF